MWGNSGIEFHSKIDIYSGSQSGSCQTDKRGEGKRLLGSGKEQNWSCERAWPVGNIKVH